MNHKSEWEKKASDKLASFDLHALVNVICSGNVDWSKLAMDEYNKRVKK